MLLAAVAGEVRGTCFLVKFLKSARKVPKINNSNAKPRFRLDGDCVSIRERGVGSQFSRIAAIFPGKSGGRNMYWDDPQKPMTPLGKCCSQASLVMPDTVHQNMPVCLGDGWGGGAGQSCAIVLCFLRVRGGSGCDSHRPR